MLGYVTVYERRKSLYLGLMSSYKKGKKVKQTVSWRL
jgi:hypothetical protein